MSSATCRPRHLFFTGHDDRCGYLIRGEGTCTRPTAYVVDWRDQFVSSVCSEHVCCVDRRAIVMIRTYRAEGTP
jgi:hypothetical protein